MGISVVLMFISFFVFLVLGMPVAWVLLVSSFLYVFVKGAILPSVIPQRIIVMLDSFVLCAVPFFLLTAEVMNSGKITDRIFNFANAIVGHIKGGLAHVNIIASVIFAGMSGSMLADIMGLGEIEVKAMLDAGYDRKFTAAVTAASAIVGPIIPPSVVLVIYGYLGEVSISRLLIGGLIPGLIIAAYQLILVTIIAHRRDYPVSQERFEFKRAYNGFKSTLLALLAPLIIVLGITTGIFTPTEAAVVASVYASIIAIFIYKSINSIDDFFQCLKTTTLSTSRVMLICALAAVFGWILTWERIPQKIIEFVISSNLSPSQFLLVFNIIIIFFGCFIEGTALIIMITPMVMPLIHSLGIDPIHFGVMFIFNVMIGLLTPPFGLGLFAVSSIAKVDIYELTIELIPFSIVLLLALITITVFPTTVLFLPNLLFG